MKNTFYNFLYITGLVLTRDLNSFDTLPKCQYMDMINLDIFSLMFLYDANL